AALAQAQSARKATLKGTTKVARKVRTTATFRLPKTLALPRTPKYVQKALPKAGKMDQFAVVKFPLNTESAMRQIEDHNTLVFVCDVRANKAQIKAAVKGLYAPMVRRRPMFVWPPRLTLWRLPERLVSSKLAT
ncbi:hypothetical protein PSACC_02251, partial [Paramicrosporidium saccamoebae]